MPFLPVLLLLAALASPPAEPRITDLTTALDGMVVQVSFRLIDAFDEPLRARLESGLPTGFTYEIDFARDRKRWWDDVRASTELEVVAMYNAVTREYLVNYKRDGKLTDSRTVRSAEELERAMTHFDALPTFDLTTAPERQRLLVRVRAELGSATWLGFIPVKKTTPWADSKKFRRPADLP